MVIDGKVAFSGGINLADEYINQKKRFGYWKDNVMMVEGEAVWSYTVLFLTNWNALRKEDTDYTKFKAEFKPAKKHDGYVSAYGETPFDDDLTSQNVYLNIINQANDYVYIATPYLIVDTEMLNALILAAKRGVDVRIITPGIPDKKIVWFITRSFYSQLVEGGVKIYEYTPGFIHSKVFVSDDVTATVGTINLDYRSLYLHFENGTYLYGSRKVLAVKDDMVKTIEESHRMEPKECDQGVVWTLVVSIIRLFAPLM
jgi:cardiolipin synthase